MYLFSPLGLAIEEERCAAPSVCLCHGMVVKLVSAG